MKPEELGYVTAIVAVLGALVKWGDRLWAYVTGAAKIRIDEGESVFQRAEMIMNRQAEDIKDLRVRVSALESDRDGLRQQLDDCLKFRSLVLLRGVE